MQYRNETPFGGQEMEIAMARGCQPKSNAGDSFEAAINCFSDSDNTKNHQLRVFLWETGLRTRFAPKLDIEMMRHQG